MDDQQWSLAQLQAEAKLQAELQEDHDKVAKDRPETSTVFLLSRCVKV